MVHQHDHTSRYFFWKEEEVVLNLSLWSLPWWWMFYNIIFKVGVSYTNPYISNADIDFSQRSSFKVVFLSRRKPWSQSLGRLTSCRLIYSGLYVLILFLYRLWFRLISIFLIWINTFQLINKLMNCMTHILK